MAEDRRKHRPDLLEKRDQNSRKPKRRVGPVAPNFSVLNEVLKVRETIKVVNQADAFVDRLNLTNG